MAKRSNPRRAGSRKRRPAPRPASQEPAVERAGAVAPPTAKEAPAGSGYRAPGSFGPRPQPPWYPLPLSELLILIGAIATAVGMARGPERNVATIIAGLGAVMLGTAEFSLREHLSGYRSHTIMLALLPVLALHTIVVLVVAAFANVRYLSVGFLVVDIALFWVLFRVLRERFQDARREKIQEVRR